MSEVNGLLRAARERTPSRRAPGEYMSRSELAEVVCAWLWETTGIRYDLDGHYIAKLERGAVRWPGAAYRSGLRHVLGVDSDHELGFSPGGRIGPSELELSSWSPAGLDDELIDAGDESVAMLTLAEESNVGDLTVEQLRADLLRITQQYLKAPTKPLFLRTRAIRDRAFRLLNGRQPPLQTRELYSAAGWAITLLGWMTVDLGRPDVTDSHTRTAWACAEAADDNQLRGWVRATQHTAAYWQDDFTRAAAYAEDGLRYATGTSRLFLAGAHALDLARSGNLAAAGPALLAAQDLSVDPLPDELHGPFLCTPERAEGIWSDAHLALGDARATLEHADRSVVLLEARPPQLRNHGTERMLRLQQVKAHLELGDLEAAATALQPVLATPPEYRVRPLIHRISEAAALTRTERFDGRPLARDLSEEIRDFVRRPRSRRRTKKAVRHSRSA